MVSIVVTTHYRNDVLPEAIESALDQTYDPVEVIVVDGSGEEHARDVANRFDVTYVAQDEDRGIAADRDLGIETATHDYIHFLDDDDRLDPSTVERKMDVMNEGEGVGVVYNGLRWENGHEVRPDPEIRGNVLENALGFEMAPCLPSTMLIDRSTLRDVAPTADLPGDDGPMKIELARRTEFDFVDDALTHKGDSPDALSSGGGEVGEDEDSVRLSIIDYYDDLYEKVNPELKRAALRRSHLLEAAVRLENQFWSYEAIRHMVLANYHSKGFDLACAGGLLASFFGRPAWKYGRRLHNRFVLGDSHNGSIS
ncbi:glycosyltransferase family 2 protein [Halococcoides cellulosivorans]|uniref:Glycosyl transferase n=1 Tax=Halococcoides cellulosivorans TaxID=1679096 RepID=A0A2R4X2Z9_9EURY|nr:glycosyltransferase family 2 protein [Halococcoides cellulosivorans]AWB28168.1 glycosyl transferase [Halococcoides cellulosivorans]